jgi:pyruvate dehydrogenase E1 component beta subunit
LLILFFQASLRSLFPHERGGPEGWLCHSCKFTIPSCNPRYTLLTRILQFGKAKIERPGKDLTIVTLSRCVGQSLVAAEQLKQKYGIEAEVINLRSIKPLDVEAIVKSVKKTGHMMAVESGFPSFGVGAELLALTAEYAWDYLQAPPVRVTGAEVPTPYAAALEEMSFPTEKLIVDYAAKLMRV